MPGLVIALPTPTHRHYTTVQVRPEADELRALHRRQKGRKLTLLATRELDAPTLELE